ncbi:MAG: NADH-quinone oxidoreductase subunit L, partial [Actinobacteria bacterium]|nr:NADH-quinone oxidoreductase subunit L [Actinomycetota bacterium]
MNQSQNLVYLIALPLFSSALLMLLGRKADKWGHILATSVSAGAFGVGLMEFFAMLSRSEEMRPVTQKLFTWISVGNLQVDASLLLDQLSIA